MERNTHELVRLLNSRTFGAFPLVITFSSVQVRAITRAPGEAFVLPPQMTEAVLTLKDLDLGLAPDIVIDKDAAEVEIVPSNRELARMFFARVGPAAQPCLLCRGVFAQVEQQPHGNLVVHLRGPHGDVFLAVYRLAIANQQ